MITNAKKNNVIPVLSVGGWLYKDGSLCQPKFEINTNTEKKRASFAASIVSEAKGYGFQGIDIDWEHPTDETQNQFTDFMKKLRVKCDENNMILTSALEGDVRKGMTNEVLKILDFANIMAYDGGDGPDHSPYSYTVGCYNFWKDIIGVPAEKLTMGVPFYSRPEATYINIVKRNPDYAMQDTAVIDGKTVYYNGIPTMKKKTEFAVKNVKGIMIWQILQDSDDKSLSLLNAIYDTVVKLIGKA